MALTMAQGTNPNNSAESLKSGLVPGLGFFAICSAAWDNSYAAGGEAADLSSIFTTVYGGTVIAETSSDGGLQAKYVRGSAGAAACGLIQLYGVQCTIICGFQPEMASGFDPSAISSQMWLFIGK